MRGSYALSRLRNAAHGDADGHGDGRMTWTIRPRQDFSLSRFSKIMRVLHFSQYWHEPTLVIDPETGKCEYRISIRCDKEENAEMIVKVICDNTDCNPSDFKLIEVDE